MNNFQVDQRKDISPNFFWVVLWLLYCFFLLIFATYFFSGLCFYLWDSKCFYWNSLVGKIFWRTSSWLPRNDIRLASKFLRSRAIQCIFKEDGDRETFFLDSVWTMFWYINLPCSKQLDLVMFIQFSLKFPLFILFVVQETLMRQGWYGSGFNRGFWPGHL